MEFVKEARLHDMGYNKNSIEDLRCMAFLGWSMHVKQRTISVHWMLPPMGFVKINSDGSTANGRLQGGFILRDSMGFVIGACAFKMGKGQTFEAELGATIEGVSTALLHGWRQIFLESDSTYIVGLFIGSSKSIPWHFIGKWRWMKEMPVGSCFNVGHIYREGNSVADALSTYNGLDDYIWRDCPPDFVLNLAAKDRYLEYFWVNL